jgi:hypothetical protein
MQLGIDLNRTRGSVLALLVGLVVACGFAALVAESASAQSRGSDFCEEYPSTPGCDTEPGGGGGGGGDGEEDDEFAGDHGDGVVPTGDAGGDGNLPFTGYPVTALVLLLLILLLGGLAIRAYLAVRDRLGGERPAR